MKLIEIPGSIYHSLRLRAISLQKLGNQYEKKIPVIVSLTSIPSRLNTLDITIRSMMLQKYQAERIVLWLHKDLKNKIPRRLSKLTGELFEIRYSLYTFSHRKLIHSLKEFSEHTIITCDDDVIYYPDTLKQLYETHEEKPDVVIGNKCREITYHDDEVLSYNDWPFINNATVSNDALVMPVGAFCVLYPPQALDQEIQNIDLFMKLAPRADDLWFKAMAIKKGTMSIQNPRMIKDPIPIMGTQFVALKKENKGKDKNRVQWNNIQKHFNWTKETILALISH